MNDINEIDVSTVEGQMLMAALAKITTESQTDKTPYEVLEQITELKDKMDFKHEPIKHTITSLIGILADPKYRFGWTANIAMAQIDSERWYRVENNKVGKYLNYQDKVAIANKGAEYFIELLVK
jgi:hypothetical protein